MKGVSKISGLRKTVAMTDGLKSFFWMKKNRESLGCGNGIT